MTNINFSKSVSSFLPGMTDCNVLFCMGMLCVLDAALLPSLSHASLLTSVLSRPSQSLSPPHHQLPQMPHLCEGRARLSHGAYLADLNQGCVLKELYPDFDKKLLE